MDDNSIGSRTITGSGTYVELNDIGESIICCNDIVSVTYTTDEETNLNCIDIDYKMISAVTIRYEYKNIDLAMKDLKTIKKTIKSIAARYIER